MCSCNTVRACSRGQPRCLSVWLDLTNRLVVEFQGCSQITCAATAAKDCAGAHLAALALKGGKGDTGMGCCKLGSFSDAV